MRMLLLAAVFIFTAIDTREIRADNDTAGRLEREAQQASNSGRYEEARQLRDLASAIKGQDTVTSRQVQTEAGQKHFDKAKEMLRIR
ncbi:MAG TPA: hypothetical protein VFA38_11360 [Nitrospirales bacterium]|nr:hypothetical protein [Nitrospirales bacterium]